LGVPIRLLELQKVSGFRQRRNYIRFLKHNGTITIPVWMVHTLLGVEEIPETHIPVCRILVGTETGGRINQLYLQPYLIARTEQVDGEKLPDSASLKLWIAPGIKGGFYRMAGRAVRIATGIPTDRSRAYRAYVQEEEGRLRIPLRWFSEMGKICERDPERRNGPPKRTPGCFAGARKKAEGGGDGRGKPSKPRKRSK
jgi:hypothetical protein